MRANRAARVWVAIVVLAALVVVVLAYDRGKKCGSWEALHAGRHTAAALATKPLLCWRLH